MHRERLKHHVILGFFVVGVFLMLPSITHATTFTVDSTSDTLATDVVPGDGNCATVAVTCTLRAAIEEANATAGVDAVTINFSAGAKTITFGESVPVITRTNVTIDGEANGNATCGDLWGLGGSHIDPTWSINIVLGGSINIQGGSSTIKGLSISGTGIYGINIYTLGNNTVQCNNISVTGSNGVYIATAGNTVGGSTAGTGNVLHGNQYGILLETASATGNTISGNFIGTNVAGTVASANANDGVKFNNAPSNTIGGTTAGARNLISGNGSSGIYVTGASATGNTVTGNYVGINASGTAAISGHPNNGIAFDAVASTIGGTTAEARNVVVQAGGGNAISIGGTGFGSPR